MIGCTNKTGSNHQEADSTSSSPIIGERIKSTADVRDTINGKILFTLNETTLVTCTPLENNWYLIGVMMDLDSNEFNIDSIKAGREIFVDGKEVGVIRNNTPASTSENGEGVWSMLYGYVPKENIDSNTIIENALKKKSETWLASRSFNNLQSFINNFQLERDSQLSPFITYYNYENWIDDPSPLFRIQLVFLDDKLIAIVHSRKINLNNTDDSPLDRDFHVAFFADTKKEVRDSFIAKFNQLINSVD